MASFFSVDDKLSVAGRNGVVTKEGEKKLRVLFDDGAKEWVKPESCKKIVVENIKNIKSTSANDDTDVIMKTNNNYSKDSTSKGSEKKGNSKSNSSHKGTSKGSGKNHNNTKGAKKQNDKKDWKARKDAKNNIDPSKETCTHCKRYGHIAKTCTFGIKDNERFLLCDKNKDNSKSTSCSRDCLSCFPRHFIVYMRRGKANFDVNNLRESGRVDVGCSSVGGALFRSQSLRQNCAISLLFGGGESSDLNDSAASKKIECVDESQHRAVSIFGSLVRGLRPDDKSVADNVRLVSSSDCDAKQKELLENPSEFSHSNIRGLFGRKTALIECIEDAVGSNMGAKNTMNGKPKNLKGVVFLLSGGATTGGAHATGRDMEVVLSEIFSKSSEDVDYKSSAKYVIQQFGATIILGDDRGLTEDDEKNIEKQIIDNKSFQYI